MRSSALLGLVLVLIGLSILFLLSGTLIRIILVTLEVLGVMVGVLIFLAGVALLLFGRR